MKENMLDYNVTTANHSIGKKVAVLRTALNLTQQQLAEKLFCSRITINKLEQIQEGDKVSLDIGFRLFYMTQKLRENPYQSDIVHMLASNLQKQIENEILEDCRISSSFIKTSKSHNLYSLGPVWSSSSHAVLGWL